MKNALVVILVTLLLFGCASVYRQPGLSTRNDAEIAVIENDPCPQIQCLIIHKIDGHRRGVGWFRRYELQPGTHTVEFSFFGYGSPVPGATNTASTSNVLVEFTARAGTVYGMRPNVSNGTSWRPEVFEKATGQIVSRIIQ